MNEEKQTEVALKVNAWGHRYVPHETKLNDPYLNFAKIRTKWPREDAPSPAVDMAAVERARNNPNLVKRK